MSSQKEAFGNLEIVVDIPKRSKHSKNEEIQIIEDEKEKLFFSKMFGISPKYKFRLTLAIKESYQNKGQCHIVVINLMYCGDLDINLVEFDCDCYNQEFGCKNFAYSRNISHKEENFLNMRKCHKVDGTTVALKLEIKIKLGKCFGDFLENPYYSFSELSPEEKDCYRIICEDTSGKEHYFKCPKIAVTRCGEILIRQFENTLNAEKPLRIRDFEPATVSSFFKFVESRVIDISEITEELTILSHLYRVLPLFRICEKYLAETKIFTKVNIDTSINFANTFSSTRLTKAIYLWITQNTPKYENWHDIIGSNEDFIKMVGIISLGLDKRHLFRYKVLQSDGIYLFPLE